MDSRYIGQIQLFDTHSLVELPKGMPAGVVKILQRARVRQMQMDLTLANNEVISRKPRGDRAERGERPARAGERPPFKAGGRGGDKPRGNGRRFQS